MIADSRSALSPIWSRYWRSRSGGTPGWRARRASPVRPFSGVRISWLVLARKALLARLAASAASRALASACSARRSAVTSSAIQIVPPWVGLSGSIALARSRTVKPLPSRRRPWRSRSIASPRSSAGPTARRRASKCAGSFDNACSGSPARPPGPQPYICSNLALAMTNLRSRVKAMPIEALARMAWSSSRARVASDMSREFDSA